MGRICQLKNSNGIFVLPTSALLLPILLLALQFSVAFGTIFDDYARCRNQAKFGLLNGTLVCDPEQRLQPKATATLESVLEDVERNVPCDCAPPECQRDGGRGAQFMALLMVLNSKRVQEDGGEEALRTTAENVWTDAGMGTEKCDNGILMLYIRDQRKMATYQGHGRFNVLSDQQLSEPNNLALLTSGQNGTGTLVPIGNVLGLGGSDGSAALAEVRRTATEDESFLGLSAIGLTIALALTFLVLVILLALLLVKFCRMCCAPVGPAAHKGSKYYVNPMPSYKSIEPIYIVTPPGSEAAAFAGAAPPSFTSAYGTGTFGTPGRPVMYGPPPPPPPVPLVQQPRSRSATPTSTHRIRRTYAPSSTRTTAQSIHSTPEAHKRDKVNRTATVYSTNGIGGGTFPASTSSPEISGTIPSTSAAAGVPQAKKKLSQPPPTIHEVDVPQQSPFPPLHSSAAAVAPPQFLPFLDPLRRQEVQTREQFIG